MLPQTRNKDLLMQNQSMRLVEQSLDENDQHAVQLAKVRYLQSVLPTPILGTSGVVLMFYFIVDSLHRDTSMLIWLALGLLTSLWRAALLFRYAKVFEIIPSKQVISNYLTQTTCTAMIAGMTFGWGWLSFYEHLSPEVQLGFLFTNIVMLFGGLYAYSPHLNAFAAFSIFSLGPALWQVQQSVTLWLAQSVGIALVALVSQMFAYRWAQNFRHNVLLQEKNTKLLYEFTKKKEQAEKATRSKSRFLASVSHDLRQPLHAINLYLAVLKRSFESFEQTTNTAQTQHEAAYSIINHLNDSATQLTRMFEALIDISKLDAGTTQPQLSPINIKDMINHLAHEFSQLSAQHGLTFDAKIPKSIDSIEVFGDPIMIERVLRNLLTNAISHTNKGGVRLRLKIHIRNGTERLEFRVVDTGPGIQASERAKIFEEFYQSDATRQHSSKTHSTVNNLGLGLAISSRLAELLNAQIRLFSYVGRGSIFSFNLPIQQGTEVSGAQAHSSREAQLALTDCLQRACVAVIDDDLHILDATSQLLKSYGTEVLTATSSQTTWQAIYSAVKFPDVFLVDHRLGKESGLLLIQEIKNKYGSAVPCILITGDTSSDQVSQFHESGLRVLYKPLIDDLLIGTICAELSSRLTKVNP
jgi:hypothetical protein